MTKLQVNDIQLFKFITAVSVVLLLIFSIVNMNLGQKKVIDDVNFSMQKQNFEHNISLIRAQWLLEGRPQTFIFNFYSDQHKISNERTFQLSQKGWPLILQKDSQSCNNLWHDVNNLNEKSHVEQYLKIKRLNIEGDKSCQFCDVGNSQACITYSSRYGIGTKHNK